MLPASNEPTPSEEVRLAQMLEDMSRLQSRVDLQNIPIIENNWFAHEAVYSGEGTADFQHPVEQAHGSFIARFDTDEGEAIDMDVTILNSPEDPQFDLSTRLFNFPGRRLFSGNGSRDNRTCRVRFTGTDGSFTSPNAFLQNAGASFGLGEDSLSLLFRPLAAEYEVKEPGEAIYWVVPLMNFAPELTRSINFSPLDKHPLRIHLVPDTPEGLTEMESRVALRSATRYNKLTLFQFDGKDGFIEPLPDYEERRERLLTGTVRHLVTSLMVGQVGDRSTDLDSVKQWFPFDLLTVLSLATGTDVGAPWVELRDAGGRLVRRTHLRAGVTPFVNGHAVIRDEPQESLTYLQTAALASASFGKSYLRVAMRHAVLSGNTNLTIEDQLSHVFRGLDCLIDEFDLGKQKKPQEALAESYCKELETTTEEVMTAIKQIARKAKTNGDAADAAALTQIMGQMKGAQNIGRGYGQSILALLDRFGLPDARIVEDHYAANPRSDGKRWRDVMPRYRGITMHRSFFDFDSGDYDPYEVSVILKHSHDLLVRILLKELGYPGPYQPRVIADTFPASVDWVTDATPAKQLGFGT